MLTLYLSVYEDFYTVDVTTRHTTNFHSSLFCFAVVTICSCATLLYSVGNVFLAFAQIMFVFLYCSISILHLCDAFYKILYIIRWVRWSVLSWWTHWYYQFGFINWVFQCKYFNFNAKCNCEFSLFGFIVWLRVLTVLHIFVIKMISLTSMAVPLAHY